MSCAYCNVTVAYPASVKMASKKEKAQCVLWYHETKSPVSLQRNFRNEYGWPPPDVLLNRRSRNLVTISIPQTPPVGQDLLIIEVSRSHSDTPQSVGLLWTSDQPDSETSTWQQTTHNTQHSQHTTHTTQNTHNTQHLQQTTLTTHNTHTTLTTHNTHITLTTHNTHTTLTTHNTHTTLTTHNTHTTLTTHNTHNTQHSQHTTLTQLSQHTTLTTHNTHTTLTTHNTHTTLTTHNTHTTLQQSWCSNFAETGSVGDLNRSGRPSVSDETVDGVRWAFQRSPGKSTRGVSIMQKCTNVL